MKKKKKDVVRKFYSLFDVSFSLYKVRNINHNWKSVVFFSRQKIIDCCQQHFMSEMSLLNHFNFRLISLWTFFLYQLLIFSYPFLIIFIFLSPTLFLTHTLFCFCSHSHSNKFKIILLFLLLSYFCANIF